MTKSISSRSAKATPKMAAGPDINGTPPTDPFSEITSERMVWMAEMTDGTRKRLTLLGGKGRVSFSRGSRGDGGEARFYRNESTKTYDAVLSGVVNIYSERVILETIPRAVSAPSPTAKSAATTVPWSFSLGDEERPPAPWDKE